MVWTCALIKLNFRSVLALRSPGSRTLRLFAGAMTFGLLMVVRPRLTPVIAVAVSSLSALPEGYGLPIRAVQAEGGFLMLAEQTAVGLLFLVADHVSKRVRGRRRRLRSAIRVQIRPLCWRSRLAQSTRRSRLALPSAESTNPLYFPVSLW